LLPLSIILSASALVLRFRRTRGDERQQLKWIAYGAVIWVIAYAATATRLWPAAIQIVYLLALGGFVLALGLAILK
jgi:hypothetical protein